MERDMYTIIITQRSTCHTSLYSRQLEGTRDSEYKENLREDSREREKPSELVLR